MSCGEPWGRPDSLTSSPLLRRAYSKPFTDLFVEHENFHVAAPRRRCYPKFAARLDEPPL